MIAFLIDKTGREWAQLSLRRSEKFDDLLVGRSGLEAFVCDTGAVVFRQRSRYLEIVVCPSRVTDAALTATATRLAGLTCCRCVLTHFERSWLHEVIPRKHGVIKRLADLVVEARSNRCGDYLSRSRPLASLGRSHPLHTIFQLWKSHAGHYHAEAYRAALHDLNCGRHLVLGRSLTSSDFVFHEIGRGVSLYDESWRGRAVGGRLQDQPDFALGKWVANAYEQTLQEGQPRLDDVDVIVSRPRQDKYRTCYQRMILPIVSGGSVSALGAATTDNSLDLRSDFPGSADGPIEDGTRHQAQPSVVG
ncbi:MAG: hypothetical protein ACR2PA_18035 [Hyphomicrobiaceae bacterium]